GIRYFHVTGVQTCALPICGRKDELFASFLGTLEQGVEPRVLAEAFDDIEGDDAELSLARNFPRVMSVFEGSSERIQAIVSRWVRSEERRVGKECKYRYTSQ